MNTELNYIEVFVCKKCKQILNLNLYESCGFCKNCYKKISENNTPVWKPYGYERNLV